MLRTLFLLNSSAKTPPNGVKKMLGSKVSNAEAARIRALPVVMVIHQIRSDFRLVDLLNKNLFVENQLESARTNLEKVN